MSISVPPVRLSETKQDITYKLAASLGNGKRSPEESLNLAVDIVLNWVGHKLSFCLPLEAEERKSFIVDEGGQRVEVVAVPEEQLWTLRLSHPDFGLGDNIAPIPGRHWVTDVSIVIREDVPHFVIRVACTTPLDRYTPAQYIRPKLIRELASRVGLNQVCPLSEEPWILHEEEDLERLKNLLFSSERKLPVLLISETDKRKWRFTPYPQPYMVHAGFLARKALGYAHVVQMPYELGFNWTKEIGMNWAAFDGAVRLYMPGLNLSEDALLQHPIAYKNLIWEYRYEDKTGGDAFAKYLVDRFAGYSAHRFLSWDATIFVPEARVVIAEQRAKQIAQLKDPAEIRERYEAQVDALRQQLEEAKHEAEQWSDESVLAVKTADYYKQENKTLRIQIEALRARLEDKTHAPVDAEIPIPDSYESMPEWVETHFAGRLVLHPRAVRALKSAAYEDVALASRALLLLANEYRDMRVGTKGKAAFETAVQQLKLDFSGSIDKKRAGEEGDTYFVSYPIGSPKKEFLEYHLRKGTTKDDRYCLAIYFFWDEETRQVIVGWMPSHLTNRMT